MMDVSFESFFGADPGEISRNCVLCQAFDAPLFKNPGNREKRGLFFKTLLSDTYSVISLKNNFLVSDCVLLLKETKAENIFLFGPCGCLEEKNVGEIFLAEKSYDFESASSLIKFKGGAARKADGKLTAGLKNSFKIRTAVCATVNSLFLERIHLAKFRKLGARIFDMESSVVFSHCRHVGKRAAALFYATDAAGGKRPGSKQREKIKKSRLLLSEKLKRFLINRKRAGFEEHV